MPEEDKVAELEDGAFGDERSDRPGIDRRLGVAKAEDGEEVEVEEEESDDASDGRDSANGL